MSRAEAQDYLRDLAEALVAALSGASVDTHAASQVGARLVAGGFTGTQSLSRTFEVLGALATSYAWALRDHAHDQTAETSTDLQLLKQRLRHQTLHDLPTGLPNRQYLLTHLEKVLEQGAPPDVVTLMHLDLDGLSTINDGLKQRPGQGAARRGNQRVVRGKEREQLD